MKQTDWKNKRQSPAENNSIVADELRLNTKLVGTLLSIGILIFRHLNCRRIQN